MTWAELQAEVLSLLGDDGDRIAHLPFFQQQIRFCALELQSYIKPYREGNQDTFNSFTAKGSAHTVSVPSKVSIVNKVHSGFMGDLVINGSGLDPDLDGLVFYDTGEVSVDGSKIYKNIAMLGLALDAKTLSVTGGAWSLHDAGSQPDAMVVEEAGTLAVRGIYPRDGENGGRAKYTLVGGAADADSIFWTTFWSILNSNSSMYGSTDNVATPNLVTTWLKDSGVEPLPTVRYATWADIDAAGIDRATVPMLEGVKFSSESAALDPGGIELSNDAGATITVRTFDRDCLLSRLTRWPASRYRELICGDVPCPTEGNYYAYVEETKSLYLYPQLLDGESIILDWTGKKLTYADADEVTFPEESLDAFQLYVRSKMLTNLDNERTEGWKLMNSYKDKRAELYADAHE